jgi:uncharacterized membrane protein (DUF4010 family)
MRQGEQSPGDDEKEKFMTTDLVIQSGYAIGIGILVGLERSVFDVPEPKTPPAEGAAEIKAEEAREGFEPSGVRTFTTFSLVGFIAALANETIPFAAPVLLAGAIALIVVLYRHTMIKSPGMTTEAAAIATLGLGALCRTNPHLAAMLGVVLTGVLSSKHFTQSLIRQMRRVEVTDTLKFLVIILIVVPLLPNRTLDPYEAVNPFKIGWLVVLISGISFVGYFLTRILGAQKGLGLTGLLGGLTSSTAVTAAMAEESARSPHLKAICACSTVVANATSFLRVLIMVIILDAALARLLVYSLGGMALVAILASGLLWVAASRESLAGTTEREGQVKLKNPFALAPALKFAAFFVLIIFVSKLARASLGDAGMYLAAAFSGLADVDAITLSVAEQTGKGMLPSSVGVLAITIAVVANAVVKSGIAMLYGSRGYGVLTALSLGAAVATGLTLAWVVPG